MHTLLPREARDALIRAATTDPKKPMERQKAIERATAWVKLHFPAWFKE